MDPKKIFRNFLVCSGVGFFIFTIFITTEILENSYLEADTLIPPGRHYTIPSWKPGYNHQARVRLIIKDGKNQKEEKIQSASFNGTPIYLSPSKSHLRGTAYTQVKPGTYTLQWDVIDQSSRSPKIYSYKKKIKIPKDTVWIDVVVEGKDYTVN